IRAATSRVCPCPEHETYPLHVALVGKVSECAIHLLLKRGGQFRTRPLQFEVRAQRRSDFVGKRDREWRTLHWISAALQKEAEDVRVPFQQNVCERNGLCFSPVLH